MIRYDYQANATAMFVVIVFARDGVIRESIYEHGGTGGKLSQLSSQDLLVLVRGHKGYGIHPLDVHFNIGR
ncbi:hypothetical protein VTP01DRAFT_2022 [Rhizomucor pusillus]|uniref:uncharacterized protein n=1 Tax=Rhizomucor pusillus TaxID=4840 RepID=UPI003742C7B5